MCSWEALSKAGSVMLTRLEKLQHVSLQGMILRLQCLPVPVGTGILIIQA